MREGPGGSEMTAVIPPTASSRYEVLPAATGKLRGAVAVEALLVAASETLRVPFASAVIAIQPAEVKLRVRVDESEYHVTTVQRPVDSRETPWAATIVGEVPGSNEGVGVTAI